MGKFYWKGRKIKNDLLFWIKALIHKVKDRFEARIDDIYFEKSIMKEVFKAFFRNVFIIVMILFLERLLVADELSYILPYELYRFQRLIISINNIIMENIDDLAGVLVAIIGVAGVFLGLYCANIMSMFAEKYANAPKKISQLFENDIVTNKSIRVITNYLIFAVMVLFIIVLKIDIGVIMLLVTGFKGLEIIVSFGFVSGRTYCSMLFGSIN